MSDLSHRRASSTPARPTAAPITVALPALNTHAGKPATLAAVLPPLPNAAGLPIVVVRSCSLPRESSPRILTPADVAGLFDPR